MALPSTVKIVDLTARDGLEGFKHLIPVEFRVELIDRLTDAGFPSIEIGEFVSPRGDSGHAADRSGCGSDQAETPG